MIMARPSTGAALSNAERQARFRKNHVLVESGDRMPQTIKRFSEDFDLPEHLIVRELLRFALCNRNWSKLGFPGVKK